MKLFTKWLSCHSQEGIGGIVHSIFRLARRFSRRIWHKKQYYVIMKSIENEPPPSEHADVIFRLAEEQDIPAIAKQMKDIYGDETFLRQLFTTGDHVVIGLPTGADKKEIMYISWLSYHDKYLLTLLGQQAATANICHRRIWVPLSYRRCGLAVRGIQYVQWQARQMGAKVIWAFVETENAISRKIHQCLAYEEYGRLVVGSFLGIRFARIKRHNENQWQRLGVQFL